MKKLLLTIILIIVSFSIFAQSFTQKGQIVDPLGEPIIGATVAEKGTTNGTITDLDGNFTLTVSKDATLVFSFLGYISKEYKVDLSQSFIKIVLEENSATLDEVVVTGYATVSKRMTTGSLATVSSDYSEASLDNSKVGLLTAGELNDFSKWMMWDSIVVKDFEFHAEEWKIRPRERYVAQLTNEDGMPIADAIVKLLDKNKTEIWQTRTDNTGKAELWANLYTPDKKDNSTYYISYQYSGIDTVIAAKPFPGKINTIALPIRCNERTEVDIMLVVDATGSMGDEIIYLQNEFHDILNKIKKKQNHLDVKVGSVFYRDHGDEYVTRKSSLDSDIKKTINFIQGQRADGGGDYPEALDEALKEAIEGENWRVNALARVVFVVLDAPAHNDAAHIEILHTQIKLAAEIGIRIIPIVCSGTDASAEYLLRSMALATNGTYVFLTDDSGIGNPHKKPSTDKYEVEILNDVIIRLITQYTQMPNCNNDKWIKEYQKDQKSDNYIPNPYDEEEAEDDMEEDLSKVELRDVMKVYPNPCKDILKVEIKKQVDDLFIVDISGKTLAKYNPSEHSILDVDVTEYSAGVYFVKAYYSGKWFTQKFIKR